MPERIVRCPVCDLTVGIRQRRDGAWVYREHRGVAPVGQRVTCETSGQDYFERLPETKREFMWGKHARQRPSGGYRHALRKPG